MISYVRGRSAAIAVQLKKKKSGGVFAGSRAANRIIKENKKDKVGLRFDGKKKVKQLSAHSEAWVTIQNNAQRTVI